MLIICRGFDESSSVQVSSGGLEKLFGENWTFLSVKTRKCSWPFQRESRRDKL